MDDYKGLFNVLMDAYLQASVGKGKERHAEDKPFEDQDICREARDIGLAGPIFQARKKCKEALRLVELGRPDQAVTDLLGAINYIAATVIVIREQRPKVAKAEMPKNLAD